MRTSTPNKKLKTTSSYFEEIKNISIVEEQDISIKKTNEIGIQCELGNEKLI